MPLPLILGVGAAIAGTVGVGSNIVGTAKIIESLDTMKSAESRHKKNIAKFENQRNITSENIDSLCKKELQILESLEVFANVFEKIQGRPQFKAYSKNGVNIPEYNAEKLIKRVSIEEFLDLNARAIIGGIFGFNLLASSFSNKADEAWEQMKKAERKINKICSYMKDLNDTSLRFDMALSSVNKAYINHLNYLTSIVETNKKTNWNDFTNKEKLLTENTVLLVNLLYNMCKVELVLVSKNKNGQNKVNTEKVNESIKNAEAFLIERGIN